MAASRKPEENLQEVDNETGWDRLKSVFTYRYGNGVPDEFQDCTTSVLVASTVGFIAGGFYGARMAADDFIAVNQFSKFTSPMQAQREMHSASMLGFVRYGAQWGWRLGVFAGLFTAARTLAVIYRDRDDVLNYVAAGSLTGGVFRVKYGLKATIGGTFVGALVSLPLGIFINGMERLLISSEERANLREMHKAKRRRREKEWRERLHETDSLIKDIGCEHTNSPDVGLQKHYSIATKNGGSKS